MPRIPTVEIEIDGRRKIVNADDPRAQVAEASEIPESPEDIAKLKKPEVVMLLEAHDAVFDKTAKVDELREQLSAIMFVGD
jgi:hypothetical protein